MTPAPKPSNIHRILAAIPQDQLDDIGFQARARDQIEKGGFRLSPVESDDDRA